MLVLAVLLFIGTILEIRGDTLYKPCSGLVYNGESKQIVSLTFDIKEKMNKFTLNSTELQSILLKPELKDKELAILSVAGSLRKGKSFFLNLLLQILEKGEVSSININLNQSYGFHWRGGSKFDTQGILMWSEPFCTKTRSGKSIALLLMDTQGAFDTQQTFGDSSSIFALSFLMSSIQLYNLGDRIQENDLQNLQVFADYGKEIAADKPSGKAFQQMVFLVRDWLNYQDYDYGFNGGQKYLDDILAIKDTQAESIKQLRNGIINSFNKLSCFLMPHPGLKVAQGNFTNKDIDEKFIANINTFSKILLDPEIIITKEFDEKKMVASQLYKTIEIYVKTFENNNVSKPENIHEARCHAKNEYLYENAIEFYTKSMGVICNLAYSVEDDFIKSQFELNKNKSIGLFLENVTKSCKDNLQLSSTYIKRLNESFVPKFEECKTYNLNKRKNECVNNSTRDINGLDTDFSTDLKAKCYGEHFINIVEIEPTFNKLRDSTTQRFKSLKIKYCESDYEKKFEELKHKIEEDFKMCTKANELKIDKECGVLKANDLKDAMLHYTQKISDKIISPNPVDTNTLTAYHNEIFNQILSDFKNANSKLCNGKQLQYNDILSESIKHEFEKYKDQNHRRLVNEANSREYTTSCVEFNEASCSDGFTSVDKWSCGPWYCPNCKKRKCRICYVDGEKLC